MFSRCIVYFSLFIGLSFSTSAANLPPGFIEQQLATNLDPTAMAMAPDGRIFITEKNGRVLIVENDVLLADPFVTLAVDNFNERGLGGIVFHPDFEFNNYIYFFYTVPGENRNRVVRVTANGNFALPGSEEVIFDLEPMAGTIHNGGGLHFGPDGKLYISVGDGADANTANSLNSLLGKVLRLNDDGSIPNDNPFYNETNGIYRSIWATGLRNSYSTAMHPVTGQLMGCDVGSNLFEEVNHIEAGGYYGWPDLEGARTNQVLPGNYRDPLHAYNHDVGCAVIGAAFYVAETPTFPPQYHDQFFFADYCEGFIKVMNPQTGEILETFATDVDRPLSLLVAPNGDFYYIERSGMGGGSMQDNTSTTNGSLWRIQYTGSGAPFISVQPADVFLPVGEDATFEVRALGAETLTYQWQRNGVDIPGATASLLTINSVQLSDNGSYFRCLIINDEGTVTSQQAELEVTSNTRPTLTMTTPLPDATYQAGDTIFFAGSATDLEDGDLPAENLRWFIDFHHDEHTHPALENYGGENEGFFVVPRIGEVDDNVWYRIYLVAEDSEGLTQTMYREVYPEKTNFTVITTPLGLRVNVDGQSVDTPEEIISVVGVRRTLSAPEFQVINDQVYHFVGWQGATNNEPLFTFLAGEYSSLTAQYEAVDLTIGDGIGLTADIFNGNEDNIPADLEPIFTRIDPVVDFNWELGGPIPEVGGDFYMVRWTGQVLTPAPGNYTFYVTADDGVRLWVDDELIIDQWVPQAVTEASGQVDLQGGQYYNIRLEYFEAGGYAEVHLEYASTLIPRTIIPTTQLFPEVVVSTEEALIGDFSLSLYPNPAEEVVNLGILAQKSEAIQWTLFDANGKRCGNGGARVVEGVNQFPIEVHYLPTGIYWLEVKGEYQILGRVMLLITK